MKLEYISKAEYDALKEGKSVHGMYYPDGYMETVYHGHQMIAHACCIAGREPMCGKLVETEPSLIAEMQAALAWCRANGNPHKGGGK